LSAGKLISTSFLLRKFQKIPNFSGQQSPIPESLKTCQSPKFGFLVSLREISEEARETGKTSGKEREQRESCHGRVYCNINSTRLEFCSYAALSLQLCRVPIEGGLMAGLHTHAGVRLWQPVRRAVLA
jgi:hypothetical protein